MSDVLATLETYYDTVPRPRASVHEVGPFTLFVRSSAQGWHYYARPRLGLQEPVSRAQVDAVRARARELGVPESLEWVHETTPDLLLAARASGLVVAECPLLVLSGPAAVPEGVDGFSVRVLGPDDDVAAVVGAQHAGFAGSDHPGRQPDDQRTGLMREGLLAMVGAYDGDGAVVGGGAHGPRGTTTELTGIAVLPRARRRGVGAAVTAALVRDALSRGVETVFLSAQDEAVARVYERVGFVRVGTACIAEAPPVTVETAPLTVETAPLTVETAPGGSPAVDRAALPEPSSAAPGRQEVRVLRGRDWAAWRDIRLRALQDSPHAFGSTYARELGYSESDWRDHLEEPDEVAVLVTREGRPVGMGGAYPDRPGLLHVVAMWVDPISRGQGVAGQVLDALRTWAGQRGLDLHLDVARGNPVARRCYERYGFVATGETRPLREGASDVVERMVLGSRAGVPPRH